MKFWLDPIPPVSRDQAIQALEEGDAIGFLGKASSNVHHLDLVARNAMALRDRKMYESALVFAYTSTRLNHRRHSTAHLRCLFEIADRTRLRESGDPLPGPGPFTAYRGVAGSGRSRRVRGFSWSADKERAQWFADRGAFFRLADPAVYRAELLESDVLAYVADRQEQEFIVMPARLRPQRVEQVESPAAT
jgi:hypothetical protein